MGKEFSIIVATCLKKRGSLESRFLFRAGGHPGPKGPARGSGSGCLTLGSGFDTLLLTIAKNDGNGASRNEIDL